MPAQAGIFRCAPPAAQNSNIERPNTMSTKKEANVTSIDDDEPAPVLAKAVELKLTDHGDNFTGRKAEVTIQSGSDVLSRQAVFLSINGASFLIPRDVPVVVPAEVVEVLNNAVMSVYEKNGNTLIERRVKRHSFSTTWLSAASA